MQVRAGDMTADTFRALPKIDAHNHLSLGMRYAEYQKWAGEAIPNFPRKLKNFDEMTEIIDRYTHPLLKTQNDIEDIFTMSLEAAIADGVTVLEGSVDISFVDLLGSIDKYLLFVDKMREKFAGKIDFRPELGVDKITVSDERIHCAIACLESKLFDSIDLYGPEIEDGFEGFVPVYALAGKLGIKRKAHVGEFSDAESVRRMVDLFDLDEVQHGIGAASDDSVLRFLKERNVRLNVCPASNVMLSRVPSLAAHPIQCLVEAGLRITIGTDDLLFFDKSISEQCADLISTDVLTKAQVEHILMEGI
jgi:adenosine deaminase